MTNNLKYFSGLTLIFSITFFYYLNSAISIKSYENIWIYAILYGAAVFISGLVLGYKDSVKKTRLDLGFQYHIITYLIVNPIGIVSLFISMGFNLNNLLNSTLYLTFWSIGLIVHYYSSKSIKGMDRENLFD